MKTRSEKECERVSARLSDYAAGGGKPHSRAAIERHVAACHDCELKLQALERTAELLNGMKLESAPNSWSEIRKRLQPRKAPSSTGRFVWWLARHKFQSAAATAAVFITIGVMLFTGGRETMQVDPKSYFANHATMSWNEPFADKAALGLAEVVQSKQESDL